MITYIFITIGISLITYCILSQFVFNKKRFSNLKKSKSLELDVLLPPYKKADLSDSFSDMSKTLVGRKVQNSLVYGRFKSEPNKHVPES
jgi:hypothetical protein